MRIAYLVVTHKNPRLLEKTIHVLSSEDTAFFIHVDKKSDLRDFSNVHGGNVFFSDTRVPVYWGAFSVVRATLLLLRRAFQSSESYDYFLLLNGSEYPLRSRHYIHTYLGANRGFEFMNLARVPAPGKPLSRVSTIRYESDKPVRRFVSRALAKVGMAQRNFQKYLGNLEPYSGRMCWALTRDACEFILDFIDQNPHVQQFYANTLAPDEDFFQTILGNSKFGQRARGNLHFEDWSVPGPHPAVINEGHIA